MERKRLLIVSSLHGMWDKTTHKAHAMRQALTAESATRAERLIRFLSLRFDRGHVFDPKAASKTGHQQPQATLGESDQAIGAGFGVL